MKTSFCITSFDRDCGLLTNLLDMLLYQTVAPDEIVVYVSGVSKLDLPQYVTINNQSIPIHTVYSSKRTIQSIARNVCAKIASGDVLIFFDIDDEPHPQKIEITNYIFNKYNIDFMLHNYISSYIRTIPEFSPINKNDLHIRTDLLQDNQSTNLICGDMPIHHAHISVKKKVFCNTWYNENIEFYRKEDGKFCQDLLNNNYAGIYCPNTLVRYIIK